MRYADWIIKNRELILRYNIWIGIASQSVWIFHMLEGVLHFQIHDSTSMVAISITGITLIIEAILCDRLLRVNKRMLAIISPVPLVTALVCSAILGLQIWMKKSVSLTSVALLFQTVFTLLGLILVIVIQTVGFAFVLRFALRSKYAKRLYQNLNQAN
ncbi:hypothetical protein ACLVWU_08595 [Bdellovibrio sp. HCB290]|uniref:hypothetical protein n=1 Tax=Bdellovibrio sp. HCB290 TaxID=3394356 RepID=UPI0039B5A1E2